MIAAAWHYITEFERSYVVNTYDFPDDLLQTQQRLDEARRELKALYERLPQYTEVWSEDDARAVAALQERELDLTTTVSTHPFWGTLSGPDRAAARMALKARPRRAGQRHRGAVAVQRRPTDGEIPGVAPTLPVTVLLPGARPVD